MEKLSLVLFITQKCGIPFVFVNEAIFFLKRNLRFYVCFTVRETLISATENCVEITKHCKDFRPYLYVPLRYMGIRYVA